MSWLLFILDSKGEKEIEEGLSLRIFGRQLSSKSGSIGINLLAEFISEAAVNALTP